MATLRRATVEDADALTGLRGYMHEAMGHPPTPAWHEACVATLRARLAADDFVGFLVEEAGEPVAGGVGWLEQHLPSPYQLDGRRGHIASMSTHPDHRRKGYARQVFRALMGWFGERDITRVDLRATRYGRPLYEAEGFTVLGGASMTWTRQGVRPGMPG